MSADDQLLSGEINEKSKIGTDYEEKSTFLKIVEEFTLSTFMVLALHI